MKVFIAIQHQYQDGEFFDYILVGTYETRAEADLVVNEYIRNDRLDADSDCDCDSPDECDCGAFDGMPTYHITELQVESIPEAEFKRRDYFLRTGVKEEEHKNKDRFTETIDVFADEEQV